MTRQADIYRQRGFTLIEMLVALLIFSLLAMASVVLLRTAVDTNAATGQRLSDMAVMQRFLSLMEADLSQAVVRPYRDEQGNRKPAFDAAEDGNGDVLLTMTRGGRSNLSGEARSSLQRVQYRLRDGRFERLYFERVDGGVLSEPVALLDNVADIRLRFRDRRGRWVDGWRPERMIDMPRAMELTFTHRGVENRHMFLVGTGYL